MEAIKDKRLELAREKLKLPKLRKKKKKYIALQLDGVSYEVLKKAMEKGYCRYIKKLVEKEGMHLQKYNCGMPSGTPAIQAGIMYGENKNIPSFRFIDKKKKRYISFARPGLVRYAEENLIKNNKEGIMKKGASYSNHFSGSADRSILTMSTISSYKRLKRMKESDLWFLLLINPASLFRVIYYSLAELSIEAISFTWNLLTSWLSKKNGIYKAWVPFRRVIANAVMAELLTKGATIDLKRGVPRIYLTFLNYDDISHLRGPESIQAFFILRAIDKRVKRIMKQAKKEGYDVFVLSDHGQVPGKPFRQSHGMDLPRFIQRCTKTKSFGIDEGPRRAGLIRAGLKKTMAIFRYVSAPLRWIIKGFAKSTLKIMRGKRYPFDWKDKKRIFVVDSCSLANVYFNFSDERVLRRKIEKKYPLLIKKLVRNRSIGIVMVKDKEKTSFIAKNGQLDVYDDGKYETSGKNFLKKYGKPRVLLEQLKEFSKKNFLGDLVLFGNIKDGVCTSFTEHVGCHGSIGKEMMEPFFISKQKYDLSKVIDAKELYKIFKAY